MKAKTVYNANKIEEVEREDINQKSQKSLF